MHLHVIPLQVLSRLAFVATKPLIVKLDAKLNEYVSTVEYKRGADDNGQSNRNVRERFLVVHCAKTIVVGLHAKRGKQDSQRWQIEVNRV